MRLLSLKGDYCVIPLKDYLRDPLAEDLQSNENPVDASHHQVVLFTCSHLKASFQRSWVNKNPQLSLQVFFALRRGGL